MVEDGQHELLQRLRRDAQIAIATAIVAMGFGECLRGNLRTKPKRQVCSYHATNHMAVVKERQAAEHFSLSDSRALGPYRPNSVCKLVSNTEDLFLPFARSLLPPSRLFERVFISTCGRK